MWLSRRGMVWLLSVWPMLAGATEPPTAGSLPPPLTSVPPEGAWHSLARLEVTTLALLPHAGLGAGEGFAQVEPTLIIDGGAEFGVNLGAPVRLRLWGSEAGGEQVRRKDWDSLSVDVEDPRVPEVRGKPHLFFRTCSPRLVARLLGRHGDGVQRTDTAN